MKVRIGTRETSTDDVQTIEADGADYQTAKAAALDQVPEGWQAIHIRVDRPEKFD